MSYKETLLRTGLKAVDVVGQRRYPAQKEKLDELRSEDYALIVFDALRYDYAAEILPLYLKGEMSPVWSAGHDTFEYGRLCWGDRVYDDWYVAGAVPFNDEANFEDNYLTQLYEGWRPDETLLNLQEAWKDAWDRSLGTVNPDELTDIARSHLDKDRLVVHYFQPHAPYIGRRSLLGHTHNDDAEPLSGDPVDKPLWERVKSGAVSKDWLRQAYRSNIHRGVNASLPLIEDLVEQDRRVVVMADHGELLGKYHNRLVSHPRLSMPQIRRVPWMEVTGVRSEPSGGERVDESTESKLKALGYR